jgi:hypothetical protein
VTVTSASTTVDTAEPPRIVEPLSDALCTTVHTAIPVVQVTSIERGSEEEKEPERVPDQPETQMLRCLPSNRSISENIIPRVTTSPVTSDMSALRELGAAVLVRAFEDAKSDSRARQWFEVTPQPMLMFWCEVAGLDCERVRPLALTSKRNGEVMAPTLCAGVTG